MPSPQPLPPLEPEELRKATFRAIVDQLDRLAHRAPLLLLFEDVHWVDPTSLELIERIERLLREGVLTRFGPLFDARRMGGAVTLCAMAVPPKRFDAVAAQVNDQREVV